MMRMETYAPALDAPVRVATHVLPVPRVNATPSTRTGRTSGSQRHTSKRCGPSAVPMSESAAGCVTVIDKFPATFAIATLLGGAGASLGITANVTGALAALHSP